MQKYQALLVILLLLQFIPLHSQKQKVKETEKLPFSLGINTQYGFIIPHSQSIQSVSDSNPYGIQINFNWLNINKSAWNQCLCYPRLGFSAAYFNFNNPTILGSAYALSFFVEPFLTYRNKINFSYKGGFGIAYLTQIYDPETNPQNLFYSSAISFPLHLSFTLNYQINEHVNLRATATYNHISNGGIKDPNKGINFPTAGIGVDYTFKKFQLPEYKENEKSIESPSKFHFLILGSAKTYDANSKKRYPLYGFEAGYRYQFARLSAVMGGVEWVADYTIKERISREGYPHDFTRAAFLAGHVFVIGNFNFSQMLGVYFYSPQKAKDPVYQRVGLTYQFTERYFFGVNLKTHLHVADFLDFRTGVRF